MKESINTVVIIAAVVVAIYFVYKFKSRFEGDGSPTFDFATGLGKGFWNGFFGNAPKPDPVDTGRALAQTGELFSGAALAGENAAAATLPAAIAIGGN